MFLDGRLAMIQKHRPLVWFGESGPIRRAIEPFLKKRMQEREAGCRLEWLPSVADKVSRARAIQSRCAMGKLYLPREAPWKADLLTQLLHFPAGRHDDGVDVLSLIGRALEFMKTPKITPMRTVEPVARSHGPTAWMRTL